VKAVISNVSVVLTITL